MKENGGRVKKFVIILGSYTFAILILFNFVGIKADDFECGCITCQQNSSPYQIVGILPGKYDTDANLDGADDLCATTYPSQCPSLKNEKGQVIYSCYGIWDGMESGACPPVPCKLKDLPH